MKTECEECGEDVGRFKHLKKIKGKRICKNCARNNRKQKREEFLENNPGLKKEIQELKNQEIKNYKMRYKKERTVKQEDFPNIKGSKVIKKKNNSSCYITLQEKQNYLRILVRRGVDFEEAKERVAELIKSQSSLRKELKKKGKSEEEIRRKQQELLEELWKN